MGIGDLRTALANTIDGLSVGRATLRASDLVVDSVNPPQAVVFRNDVVYDLDQGDDGSIYGFTIRVYAGRVSERSAQLLLDALSEPSGAGSLKQTVEADAALRALCDWVIVKTAGAVKVTTVAQVDFLTTDFVVEIVT